MRKAAIDVGSNSVLLLIEEDLGSGWHSVYEETRVTSLGARTKKTGVLSELGMSDTLKALACFYDKASEFGAEVLCAATMAARIARNQLEFLTRAKAQSTPVFILSGEDEAQLGFDSVVTDPMFSLEDRITIVDVGGQSTEITTGTRAGSTWTVLFRKSFPIGTLALTGGVMTEECPSIPQILLAVVEIDDAIGMCYRRDQCGLAVCLGATGTNLVAIRDGIRKWDPNLVHGAWLDFGEVSEAAGRLFQMTIEERKSLIGIEPGREATLPSGALILERALNAIGAQGVRVSTRGWRHALLELGLPRAREDLAGV
jgi:exopolyphosphatase/guanosine-5'-triphosphate,3'-diphosphate pyrophosphatase